jgi:CDP-glycerol glycerophosphotransferase
MSSEIAVVIAAAGEGRRMKRYGPKALIPLKDGRTVVRRQIDVVRQSYPGADVVVVVGHDAERVVKTLPSGVRVVENERHEQTSVVRSIGLGLRATAADRVLVVYGDLVFNRPAVAELPQASCLLVDRSGQVPAGEVGVTLDGDVVVHLDYGLPVKWASIAMLTGRELHLMKAVCSRKDRHRVLTYEVLNEVIDRGGVLTAAECKKLAIVDIDCSQDVARAAGVGA